MHFGVNLLLYSDIVTKPVMARFSAIRRAGADGIEVPVFDPSAVDVDAVRRAADAAGLRITVSGALPPGCRWYGRSAAPKRKAERYMKGCIDVAAKLGAPVICGPLFKTVGDMDESTALPQQRREAGKAMHDAAQEAARRGITLALEPLNRFETNMLNTVEQGIEFCRLANSPGAGLLLDTFHMHIEEKNTPAAIIAAAKAGVLAHFHSSENDRGTAGSGQIHWQEVAAALHRARYDKWVVLESFSQTVEAIRTAVSCWRPFYGSPGEFTKNGLGFIRKLMSNGE